MEDVLDARDQLLTEKAGLLAEREALMDEEIRQLKAQLAEEKEKTMAAELIAEQALQAGMKSTRNWEKEKKRRKIAEEILRSMRAVLDDSVTTRILPQYQPAETIQEISRMDKQTVKSHCLKYGINTEGKGIIQLKRELQKHVEAEPVPEPVAEPVPEPVAEPTQEPVPEPVAEPVQEPVQEPAAEPVQEQVETPSARYVITTYEKFLTDVETPTFWNTKLLREHANQLGINPASQNISLLASVRQAVNENVRLAEPLVLLGHFEERLKQERCAGARLNKDILKTHCEYYSINTDKKSKSDLMQLLLQRLA